MKTPRPRCVRAGLASVLGPGAVGTGPLAFLGTEPLAFLGTGPLARVFAAVVLALGAMPALAQPGPDGIDWVTVGAPNNPAYHGPDPENRVTGRGSVPYEYRLSRTEVTTASWLEFFNSVMARQQQLPWANSGIAATLKWGATRDFSYTGPGQRYRLLSHPDAAMRPVYGVSWRAAAMYCNWLHNGKSSDASAFLSGAYDVSTFADNPDGTFTDQVTRSPGARYWIPSLDEWIKGAHYSPANPNLDGWHLYPNQRDVAPAYGPPISFGGDGTGQANAGFSLSGFAQYLIPLGSYPTEQSYWGLLDTAGCGGEWMEEILRLGSAGWYRYNDGSRAGMPQTGASEIDATPYLGAGTPSSIVEDTGLRIASLLPSPGALGSLILAAIGLGVRRPRRRISHEHDQFSDGLSHHARAHGA